MISVKRTGERTAQRDLVLAANAEPYRHRQDEDGPAAEFVPGGLTAGLDPIMQRRGQHWICWGRGEEDFHPAVVEDGSTVVVPPEQETNTYQLQRIRLSTAERTNYYLGMANQVLWPAFHGFTEHVEYDAGFWKPYVRVNRRFADSIVEHTDNQSKIQIHDFHLLLAPRFVAAAGLSNPVGCFLHIPVPTAEQFRQIPHSGALFAGVSGADLIGVQTDRDRSRLLDIAQAYGATVDRDAGTYTLGSQETRVVAIPIGIDVDRFTAPDTPVAERAVRQRFDVDHLLFTIGRIDYTKGWLEGLDAYDALLDRRPDLEGDICLYMNVTPSRQDIPAYRELTDRIQQRAAMINRRYGNYDWQPVVLSQHYLSHRQLVAAYRAADSFLVPSLADGMNLVAKEFVAANHTGNHDGMLVLGKQAGAATQLTDAVHIDPQDTEHTATALADTILMDADERRDRMQSLYQNVTAYDIDWWADTYMETLEQV